MTQDIILIIICAVKYKYKSNLHLGGAMKNTIRRSMCVNPRMLSFFVLSFFLLLTACSPNSSDESSAPTDELSNQEALLKELESNQLKWANAGVSKYSFTLDKSCDCPEELTSKLDVLIDEDDDDEYDEDISFKPTGIRSRTRRSTNSLILPNQNSQNPSIERFFADLRQAILQNSVQQVSYDPNFGVPTIVSVNGQNSRAANFNANPNEIVITIRLQNFNAIQNNQVLNTVNLEGQFIHQVNQVLYGNDKYWLIDASGNWYQLNVPAGLSSIVNNIPDQASVQVIGDYTPGGISSQGIINVHQITQTQNNPLANNLQGILNYSVQNNGNYGLNEFYVITDQGRTVFLDVADQFVNQAYSLAGQRVNLTGTWLTGMNDPNGRFIPDNFNTTTTALETFTGILQTGSSYQLPGFQTNNFVLLRDDGSMLELQVPQNVASSFTLFVGKRVEIRGTRLNAGNFGQPIIMTQELKEIQNLFSNNIQIRGTIETILPGTGFDATQRLYLRMDTGSTITVRVPDQFGQPQSLSIGMQVQVTGVWISNFGVNQGEFEARSPIQVITFGNTTNANYSGYISSVGGIGSGFNCNANQNTYGFNTDTGRQFNLMVSNNTQISGLTNFSTTLPYQARVQVTGTEVSPGVLHATSIIVTPQNETFISGTIIEIGPVDGTFNCAGTLNTYRLLDSFGNAYSITTDASSVVQGSLGAFLRVGDQVHVTGFMSGTGATFYASKIMPSTIANPNVPTPTPNNNVMSTVGTITGVDCSNTQSEIYNFVDHTGTLYKLSVGYNLQASTMINVGSQFDVTGIMNNGNLIAQQIAPIQTFADPFNRTPMPGTIVSMIESIPSSCGTISVYTYQFQSSNGLVKRLRLTREAALNLPQPLPNGAQITVVSSLQSNNPQVIDALEVQYTNGQFFGNNPPTNGFGNGFGTGVGGQTSTFMGTITATSCNNEYYFVDQNGQGFQLVLNNTVPTSGFNIGVGVKLTVTGHIIGNQLMASTVFPDRSQIFSPVLIPTSGTISATVNTETFGCGLTVTTYAFNNDSGRSQLLRVANTASSSAQFFTQGSRVVIGDKVESFDGGTIDAINITRQGGF